MRPGLQRRLATGTNALLVAGLVIAIVAIAVDVAGRYRLRWDLSFDATATLLPETVAAIELLDGQDEIVTVTAFSAQRKNTESWYRDRTVRDFLRELEYRSARVRTRFVNFDRDRLTAESLGVDRYGTIVIEGRGDRVDLIDREIFRHRGKGDDRELVFLGEGAIAKGIRQVLTDQGRTLYMLAGHGEREIFDRGLGELKTLAELIDHQGWAVQTLNLLRDRDEQQAPFVPEDASAVLVVGATQTITGAEDQALREYLGRGGSVGFFVDPNGSMSPLLADLGVSRPDGVALDAHWVHPHQDRPLLRYRNHPITDDLIDANSPTVVAHAAPIVVDSREGVHATTLLQTSRRGWIERGTERPSEYDEEVDGEGPVVVGTALAVARPHPMMTTGQARLLVVGDADLLLDEMLDEGPGNRTFAVNGMRWLVGADDRMSLVGRPSKIRKLALTPEQLAMIRWMVIGGLPFIAVFAGAGVWVGRRGR